MTKAECRREWETFCGEAVRKIDEIDSEVPFASTEPKWWLAMMEVRSKLLNVLLDARP